MDSPKEGSKPRDWEEIDLDNISVGARSDASSTFQNYMVIYDEGVDEMLEDLDEDSDNSDEPSEEPFHTPAHSVVGSSLPKRKSSGSGDFYPGPYYHSPPPAYKRPPTAKRVTVPHPDELHWRYFRESDGHDTPEMKMKKILPPLPAPPPASRRIGTRYWDEMSNAADENGPKFPSAPGITTATNVERDDHGPSSLDNIKSSVVTPRSPMDTTLHTMLSSRKLMTGPTQHPRTRRGFQIAKKMSELRGLIKKGRKGTEKVFDMLIRSVKLKVETATNRILKTMEECGEDICDEKYRIKESSANLLHVALLHQRTDLVHTLLRKYPNLIRAKYTSKEYRNQTCFHIAAANDNRTIIANMLAVLTDEERKEFLNTIADGSYFVDERPEAALCLSAAVWNGQVEMIPLLVESGADLGLRSVGGNTLLHYIIYLSVNGMDVKKGQQCIREVYECCNVWWSMQNANIVKKSKDQDELKFDAFCHLLSIRNESGLIPAALAVNIHSPLTSFILRFEPVYKVPQVKFGAVAWATYDVTDILSYKERGPKHTFGYYDCSSVFHVLAHTERVLATSDTGAAQKDIAEIEPINSAIEMKWSVFRWVYILWFLAHSIYMSALTGTVLHFHETASHNALTVPYTTLPPSPTTNSSNVELLSSKSVAATYAVFLILPVLYVIFEFIDLGVTVSGYGLLGLAKYGPKKRHERVKTFFLNHCTITGNAPYRLISSCFALCMFVWYGMYLTRNKNCDIPLSMALILGWIFMLNFTRACRHVCRFSIMIQKMFFRDFLYFVTVYMFILIAFSSAVHLLLPPGQSVGKTVLRLLNIVTNAADPEDAGTPLQKHYSAVLLSLYGVLAVILLLNMLIAMMNTSYESVKSSRTNLWRYQQLSILLMLERRLVWFTWLCKKSQGEAKTCPLPKSNGDLHHRIFLDVTEDKLKS